jgi:hypothetical protein
LQDSHSQGANMFHTFRSVSNRGNLGGWTYMNLTQGKYSSIAGRGNHAQPDQIRLFHSPNSDGRCEPGRPARGLRSHRSPRSEMAVNPRSKPCPTCCCIDSLTRLCNMHASVYIVTEDSHGWPLRRLFPSLHGSPKPIRSWPRSAASRCSHLSRHRNMDRRLFLKRIEAGRDPERPVLRWNADLGMVCASRRFSTYLLETPICAHLAMRARRHKFHMRHV